MPTFRNTDVNTRVWISLQRPDGSTLELAPGEQFDLDLPDSFADPHLTVVPRKPKRDLGETPSDATTPDKES